MGTAEIEARTASPQRFTLGNRVMAVSPPAAKGTQTDEYQSVEVTNKNTGGTFVKIQTSDAMNGERAVIHQPIANTHNPTIDATV